MTTIIHKDQVFEIDMDGSDIILIPVKNPMHGSQLVIFGGYRELEAKAETEIRKEWPWKNCQEGEIPSNMIRTFCESEVEQFVAEHIKDAETVEP